MRIWLSNVVLAAAALLAVLPWPLLAADSTTTPEQQQESAEEIKSLEDQSILKRRVWLDTEWNKYKDGRHELEETFGWRWAWAVSKVQDWDVRLEVPLRQHIAGDDPSDHDRQGLGDVEIGTGTAFRFNDTWRIGGGLKLRTPSGSIDILSDNTWRIQEYGSLGWDVTPWLTLSPAFEYNQSFIEEPGAARRHFLETFFPVTVLLPRDWSVTARYETRLDFASGNDPIHSGKFTINKLFPNLPLNVGASFEKPFNSDTKDFQVNLVFTYYFDSRKDKLTQRIFRNLFRLEEMD